jgi:hypothetical protein
MRSIGGGRVADPPLRQQSDQIEASRIELPRVLRDLAEQVHGERPVSEYVGQEGLATVF